MTSPGDYVESGYCSGFLQRQVFSFEPEDLEMSTDQDDVSPSYWTNERRSPCAWSVANSAVYQRRKRSSSCPSSKRTFELTFSRSRSLCEEILVNSSSTWTPALTTTIGTQTEDSYTSVCHQCANQPFIVGKKLIFLQL